MSPLFLDLWHGLADWLEGMPSNARLSPDHVLAKMEDLEKENS